MAGPLRIVSRPITLQAVFPGGTAKAELTSSLRSLLRCDPLNDATNAYAHQ